MIAVKMYLIDNILSKGYINKNVEKHCCSEH